MAGHTEQKVIAGSWFRKTEKHGLIKNAGLIQKFYSLSLEVTHRDRVMK
jgi:hypothetical protein